jgi:LysM repeat protein
MIMTGILPRNRILHRKRLLLAACTCIFGGLIFLFAQSGFIHGTYPDPPAYQKKNIVDTALYPWMHEEFNMIQFYSRDAMEHFYKVWDQTSVRKLSIVHTGDSHCQSDILPGQLRKELQKVHGDGGRGMTFAYSTAKSYSSVEYKTSHTGEWTYGKGYIVPPKLPLGVVGMASNTISTDASITLKFDNPVPATHNRLKLFVRKQHSSYDCIIEAGTAKIPVIIDSIPGDTIPYYEIELPAMNDLITIRIDKKNDYEKDFEFYGMSFETATNSGAIVHNCGVGAARYESILYEELFNAQLPTLHPDLVIIDFGTNEYLYGDSLKPTLAQQITDVIHKVKAAAPEASILLTSTMDMYHRGVHVVSGESFSNLVGQIAKKEHCGLFDWYWIAGGWKVMMKWEEAGTSQQDKIHLSVKGYRLKGQLLADALMRTADSLKKNPDLDSLVLFTDSIRAKQHRLRMADTTENNGGMPGRIKVQHRVKSGESLGSIARKYGVTVAEIKKWNHLRSNMIHPKQVLIIYKKKR